MSPVLLMQNDDARRAEARAARVVRAGALLAVFTVFAQSAAHVVNRAWLENRHLNADVDGNLLTWLTASATVAGALAALAIGVLFREHRLQLVLLSAILGLLALDDVIAVHERVSGKTTALLGIAGDYGRALWPALYFPLLLFVLLTLWRLAGRIVAPAAVAIRVGLALLVAAVGAEMLWSAWHLGGGQVGDWPDTIQVAIEEGMELAGWILIAAGLTAVALARVRCPRASVRHDRPGRLRSNEAAPSHA
jgi:hypothetical protein